MTTRILFAGLALCASEFASSKPNYAVCVDASDPPGCIARAALSDGWPERGDVAEAIIRHGLIDLVPRKSRVLVRVAYEEVGSGTEFLQSLGLTLPEGAAEQAARQASSKVVLAAVALLTAARHQQDPFSDPVVRSLADKASNHPSIPAVALSLWVHFINGGNTFDKSVEFAGLRAIWRQVAENRELAPAVAQDLASWLAFYDKLDDETQDFMLWFASRPSASPLNKASVALQLMHYYSIPDEAERLLDSIGDAAPSIDIPAVRARIAVARLKARYDAKDARLVVAYYFDRMNDPRSHSRIDDSDPLGALEQSGAKAELRDLADEYMRLAQLSGPGEEAMDWYADASGSYRRAGDLEKAREVARMGFPFVADAVRRKIVDRQVFPGTSPRWLAAMSRGFGTAPVIALYCTGAIDEALKFGYLSGKDRYQNAEIAGEPRNPQWVLDDDSRIDMWSMVTSAVRDEDLALRRRVFDALKNSCKTAYSDCYDETLVHLGGLAGSLGDEVEMKRIFLARTTHLEKTSGNAFSAVRLAAEYAHSIDLLEANR